NVTLATGQIGRPGAGYGTLTGQGNGRGGREHGQKSDMLPGGRDITNLEHRAYVAGVWGVDEADLPQAGTSMHEMVRQMAAGEIRGLLGMCNNPFVSLPNQAVVRAGYDALEFHVQSDFFLSETAARADVVLPSTVWPKTRGLRTNERARGPGGLFGPARPSTPPARRGRSRAAASTTPTARPTSSPSSGGPRPSRPTTSSRCASPPGGRWPTSCPATRLGGCPAWSSRPRGPGSRSTRRWGSPTATRCGW